MLSFAAARQHLPSMCQSDHRQSPHSRMSFGRWRLWSVSPRGTAPGLITMAMMGARAASHPQRQRKFGPRDPPSKCMYLSTHLYLPIRIEDYLWHATICINHCASIVCSLLAGIRTHSMSKRIVSRPLSRLSAAAASYMSDESQSTWSRRASGGHGA